MARCAKRQSILPPAEKRSKILTKPKEETNFCPSLDQAMDILSRQGETAKPFPQFANNVRKLLRHKWICICFFYVSPYLMIRKHVKEIQQTLGRKIQRLKKNITLSAGDISDEKILTVFIKTRTSFASAAGQGH